MASILSKLKKGGLHEPHTEQSAARPPAAVELTTEGVVAAALPAKSTEPVYAYEPLKPGALRPGTSDANIVDEAAIGGAIAKVLAAVEPRSRFISLIVPDLSARVFVLDFDSLPAKAAEAASIIRFRLRKMVPFEIEGSGVSYQILEENRQGLKALVAVIPALMLAEYEGVVRAAGYEPGAVIPSGLAVLSAIQIEEPALVASLSAESLTTAVTDGKDLQLYRTIELPRAEVPVDGPLAAETAPAEIGSEIAAHVFLQGEIQRDLAVAVAYYEDCLGVPPTRIHFAGFGGRHRFADWVGEPDATLAGMTLVDIAPAPDHGAATSLGPASLAAVQGALVGVN